MQAHGLPQAPNSHCHAVVVAVVIACERIISVTKSQSVCASNINKSGDW